MKILVAEDDPCLQMFAGYLMEKWGYEYDIAINGQKAVELAKANEGKYDLCLMDIEMPLMSGCEATKVIRQKIKYLPIMALTGNVALQDKYVDFGIDDFLEKPYDPDMLRCKINELTVKSITVGVWDKNFYIKKEIPVNSEHLKELRRLREKGLTKLYINGSGCEIVVDERVQNKISHDLIGKKQELSEFLDRSEDKPGICHLYKATFMVNTKYLLPEEFDEYMKNEEKFLKECKSTVVRPLGD